MSAKKSRKSPVAPRAKAAEQVEATHAPEQASLRLRTLESLRTIFGSARTHDAEVRRSAGISGSQLWALSEIAHFTRAPGITVNRLSAQMALHQTTTSNLVNSLVEHGLIRRERDTADQRVVICERPLTARNFCCEPPARTRDYSWMHSVVWIRLNSISSREACGG